MILAIRLLIFAGLADAARRGIDILSLYAPA